MFLFDLHTHSTASDGTLKPAEVVIEASQRGLRGIALTDHDTLLGIPEAVDQGKRVGIEVIGGVEISTAYNGQDVHVLGYGLKQSVKLEAALAVLQKAREQRLLDVLVRLAALGVVISKDDVLVQAAGADSIGRPHIARALVAAGHVASVGEAFERFLGRGKPAYVERESLTPMQAVRMIRESSGVAVLAHPGLVGDDSLLDILVHEGLQGLEVTHPDHDARARERYSSYARSRGLLPTGGSDFHGASAGHRGDIGTCGVEEDGFVALRAMLGT